MPDAAGVSIDAQTLVRLRSDAELTAVTLVQRYSVAEQDADSTAITSIAIEAGEAAEKYFPHAGAVLRIKELQLQGLAFTGEQGQYDLQYRRFMEMFKQIAGLAVARNNFKRHIYRAIRMQQYDRALRAIESLRQVFLHDQEAEDWGGYMTAECYAQMGASDVALGLFDSIRHLPVTEFRDAAAIKMGILYMRESNWMPALKTFQEYLRRVPQGEHSAQAQYLVAWIYDVTGDRSMAMVEYKKVVDNYSDRKYTTEAYAALHECLAGVVQDVIEF